MKNYHREPPKPVTALFPGRNDRERWSNVLTRELALAAERVVNGPVTPTLDLTSFRGELANFDFQTPCPMDRVMSWTITQLERGVVHLTHPRYFGLFNPAPTFPAQCADRIAAAFNPQLATSTTSPAAVEIEAHVIRSVGRRAGSRRKSPGTSRPGGAEANYTALICALTRSNSVSPLKALVPSEARRCSTHQRKAILRG